jgi:hypothetical protein
VGRNSIARSAALLWRLLCVTAVAGGIVVAGVGLPLAHADPSGANRYGACVAAQKSGDLLLLFDESSSLQATDSKAARVSAAKYLVQTLGRYADRVHADLSVATAGFSDGYVVHQDWTKLTGTTADNVGNGLQPQASRNTGIDTDYWLAFDGARQTLASRGAGQNGGDRCQAIAFFTDGKIDFTARPLVKPYANGISLDAPNGVDATVKAATESICRPGGVADQLRSRNIVMLAVGLSGDSAPSDFDALSAISTGKGVAGMSCGGITSPKPGDFYPVSNIDDMLFAFDALNPDPGISQQGSVCRLQVCPEARHDFVLDRSIKSVSILGSGGIPGIVPYLISPSGQTIELANKPGSNDTQIAGSPVEYQWQSDSAQSITLRNTGAPEWAGRWAIVYVDTTGAHPDAVSKVSIHITTDIYPALVDGSTLAWHGGQVLRGVRFGLTDGQGHPLAPDALAGTATMSATLVPDGAAPIPLLAGVAKPDIAKPVDADLTSVKPGHAVLRMELAITTAAATDAAGVQIATGTPLSPQDVELPIQILPRVGLATPGERVDFGTVQAAEGATGSLSVTGPGCVWIAGVDAAKVIASPDGVGSTKVTSPNNSPDGCLKVAAGQTASLTMSLRTDHDGRGGLTGTIPVHIAALDNPNDNQVVDVPFVASLTKPVNTTNFVLTLIAALLLGPGIPLALLYGSKWGVSKIPSRPLLAERIDVEVNGDAVTRDQAPFALADTDLVRPVPGLATGTRRLAVLGVTLVARMGKSPFGAGYVMVETDGLVSAGSQLPSTDRSGLRAVLPLAVHNTWVLLHDPSGPAEAAQVLLLVGGRTDVAARERVYADVARRLPELLRALRAAGVQAGLASPHDPGEHASPFGAESAGMSRYDPFSTDAGGMDAGAAGQSSAQQQHGDRHPFDPFGEGT